MSEDDVKKSLVELHKKQDDQSVKLHEIEISLAKTDVKLEKHEENRAITLSFISEIREILSANTNTLIEQKLTLDSQAKDLAYHIKRTDVLESMVTQKTSNIDQDIKSLSTEFNNKIKPLSDHVNFLNNIGWFAAKVAAFLATLTAIWHYLFK